MVGASLAQELLLRFQRSSSLWASCLIQGDKNNYGAMTQKGLTKMERHSPDSDSTSAKTINNSSPMHMSPLVF
jgi:hypothetical protein